MFGQIEQPSFLWTRVNTNVLLANKPNDVSLVVFLYLFCLIAVYVSIAAVRLPFLYVYCLPLLFFAFIFAW